MLYIVEECHMGYGSGSNQFAVEAENDKEAEKLANEFIRNDSRVLFPKLTKMIAGPSFCPVVLTKENIADVKAHQN